MAKKETEVKVNKKNKQTDKVKSIRNTLMAITIIPLVLLITILTVISAQRLEKGMEEEVENGLKCMVKSVNASLANMSGDYYLLENHLHKGFLDLTEEERVIDSYVDGTNMDITFFYGDTRYATTLVDKSGNRIIGTQASETVANKVLNGEEYFAQDIIINDEEYYGYYVPLISTSGVVGMVFAGEPAANVNEEISAGVITIIVVAIIGVLITVAFATYISLRIAKSVKMTEEVVSALADGDLTIEVDPTILSRKDELGAMARAVEKLVTELRDIISKIQEASHNVLSSGDELESMASQTSQTADDISSAVDDISKGAVTQAEDVETATGKVAEMGLIIEEMVDNISRLNQTSLDMQSEGNESAKIMAELAEATNNTVIGIQKVSVNVEATDTSVQEITEAVNLITGIASQTNLLSLNASIEAARAGEAGRGFAVVASEIQHLSEESSNSAKRIAEIVNRLSSDSRQSMEVMEEVKVQLDETQAKLEETMTKFQIVNTGIETSRSDTNTVNGQAKNCDEARGVMVDIIQNLSAISEENAASTEETTASMQELNATINILAESAAKLKELAVSLDENTQFFRL